MAEPDAHSETSVTLPPDAAVPATGDPSRPPPARRTANLGRDALPGAFIFVSVLLACTIGYLVVTAPGAWFPHASPKAWNAKDLTLVRGTGRVVGDELVVSGQDADAITLVTVTTEFPSSEYPGIAWIVADLPEDADVRLLWRSDFQPDKLNSTQVRVESGRTTPIVVAKNPAWIGHITGLALAIHGRLAQAVVIRGVIAKPMGVVGIVRDRLHEWFAFEPWNGASINTITGGADNQDIPLPAVVALVVGISGIAALVIRRWRPGAFSVAMPAVLAAFFLAGWMVLDARWTWNLFRQEHATAVEYAGKDLLDKHLASDDGPLFAFIQQALAVLPKTPVRIFIAADADYFRGRAAYHLYPHSVYFNPRSDALPPATAFHAGDWLLVFQRHGIQFDKVLGKIRWDGNQTVNAELKLLEPGAALFVIR